MRRSQEDHADLGLIDNDLTEDMRKAPVAPEALQEIRPTLNKQGDLR
jgi:hypothetical protein